MARTTRSLGAAMNARSASEGPSSGLASTSARSLRSLGPWYAIPVRARERGFAADPSKPGPVGECSDAERTR